MCCMYVCAQYHYPTDGRILLIVPKATTARRKVHAVRGLYNTSSPISCLPTVYSALPYAVLCHCRLRLALSGAQRGTCGSIRAPIRGTV